MKLISILTLLACAMLGAQLSAQEPQSQYSVFGPPRPAEWEFQAAAASPGQTNGLNGFSLYRKNQRQKTNFMSLYNTGDGATSQLQLTAGSVLFPYHNDDRLQLELGGSVFSRDTGVSEIDLMTRLTLRPFPWLWIRGGFEGLDNGIHEDHKVDRRLDESNQYFAVKVKSDSWQFTGAAGTQHGSESTGELLGGGVYKMIGRNYFVFSGYLSGSTDDDNVRTIAVGRWAGFRPDGKPSMIYVWKHKNNYDFQLGALFFGGRNLFVRPAALGMTQGIFLSNLGLTENSDLRRRQLMAINDESRNSDISLFFVAVDRGVEMIPGQISQIGIKAFKFFKLFPKFGRHGFSTPLVGLFFTQESIPDFGVDENYFSGQLGVYYKKRHLLNVEFRPSAHEWTVAYSLFHGGH